MELIEEKDYPKVWKILDKVEESKMYIEGVILGQMVGTVLVDNVEDPKVAWVRNFYGMCLLFGETNDKELIDWIIGNLQGKRLTRKTSEWLQLSPPSFWYPIITSNISNIPSLPSSGPISQEILYQCERVNFTFDPLKFKPFSNEELNSIFSNLNLSLKPISREVFLAIDDGLVIPSSFCKSVDVWIETGGMGYCLVSNDDSNKEDDVKNWHIASWACSAGIIKNQLEIAIETIPSFRKKGLARVVCSALIEYCISKSLTPVWNCRRSNLGSVNLALALGFVEKNIRLPYFHVPISH